MKKRLLGIVIPHYNEEWDVFRPMFDILNAQRGIDFEQIPIWLVHNGDQAHSMYLFNQLNDSYAEHIGNHLDVSQVQLPTGAGVSAARNWGIDHANTEWICFCDCDDCFTSIYSLKYITSILSKPEVQEKFDLMWAPFYEDKFGELKVADKQNFTFVHNKFYKTSFLRNHNLRFPERLFMSEDSAFNTLVSLELDPKRIGRINYPEPLYAWCRRENSVTMDKSRWIKNMEGHFLRNMYIIDELVRRNKREDLNKFIARAITDVYSGLTKQNILNNGDNLLIDMTRGFYYRHKKEWNEVSEEDKAIALQASDRDFCVSDDDRLLRTPLDIWIKARLEN